jgi:hypothetical protein
MCFKFPFCWSAKRPQAIVSFGEVKFTENDLPYLEVDIELKMGSLNTQIDSLYIYPTSKRKPTHLQNLKNATW